MYEKEKRGWSESKENVNSFIQLLRTRRDLPTIMVSHGKFMRELRQTIQDQHKEDMEAEYIYLGVAKKLNKKLVDVENHALAAGWKNTYKQLCKDILSQPSPSISSLNSFQLNQMKRLLDKKATDKLITYNNKKKRYAELSGADTRKGNKYKAKMKEVSAKLESKLLKLGAGNGSELCIR